MKILSHVISLTLDACAIGLCYSSSVCLSVCVSMWGEPEQVTDICGPKSLAIIHLYKYVLAQSSVPFDMIFDRVSNQNMKVYQYINATIVFPPRYG